MTAQFSSASPVEAPRCGRVTTFGWSLRAALGKVADVGVQLPGVERREHRRLVDDGGAREVQDDAARAHELEARRVDQAAGVLVERHVHA